MLKARFSVSFSTSNGPRAAAQLPNGRRKEPLRIVVRGGLNQRNGPIEGLSGAEIRSIAERPFHSSRRTDLVIDLEAGRFEEERFGQEKLQNGQK